MPRLPNLSVEVWEKILRHSMYVPDFLDPDAFEGILGIDAPLAFEVNRFMRDDEGEYWSVEKRRNILRLVCKSWNDYCNLPRFQHRFVRMTDIWQLHGIGKASLKTAIRVKFSPTWAGCCRKYSRRRYDEFCIQTVASVGSMEMEIADFLYVDVDNLTLQNMKKVKAITSSVLYKSLPTISREMQDLNHLRTNTFKSQSPLTPLRSSTLVSLSLSIKTVDEYNQYVWNFPSLRHLGIINRSRSSPLTFLDEVLIPILHMVGSRLQSLYVTAGSTKCDIPSTIWNVCPILERIHAHVDMEAPPPRSHPLHTLSIPHSDILSILSMDAPIFTWPNLRKVVTDTNWNQIGPTESQEFWIGTLEWTRLGISIEDIDGETLESFVQST